MEAGPSAPSEPTRPGYSGAGVAGAVLATLFFPLFALIAALLLLGGQTDARKRSQLRTWAWVSGGWVVLSFVLVLLAVGVVGGSGSSSGSRSGPCVGGPKIGAAGTHVPGSMNKFVEPCAISGAETVTMP
ncbi:MAG: hypothetical protein ACJ75G_06640 [Gaiellaceae bacterium]